MESLIWTEKYRPQTFADIKGQKDIVEKVQAFVRTKNMPHLLFAGPAGVGKTTLALVIAKELYGDLWRENMLELNASDERGIDIVRVKVKDFARTKALGDVPFKLIYLDESDALTREAQQALRRTMENYTKTCRFILSCNYSSKILDPIQSRCAIFRFKPLSKDDVRDFFLNKLKGNESFIVSGTHSAEIDFNLRKVIDALYEVSEGDLRRVLNILQSCHVLGKELTPELIYSMASVATPKEVREVLQQAVRGDFSSARKQLLSTMLSYGVSGLDIIKQVQKEIWGLALDDRKKMELVDKCGEVEFRMVEGSDEYLQLESFLAFVALVGSKD